MSQILTALESSPYSPSISLSSPIYNLLQCAAEHGTTLPKSLVRAVDDGGKNGKKGEKGRAETARLFAELDPVSRYLVTTSQAVDVIIGGVKGRSCLPFLLAFADECVQSTRYRSSFPRRSTIEYRSIRCRTSSGRKLSRSFRLLQRSLDSRSTLSDSRSMPRRRMGNERAECSISSESSASIILSWTKRKLTTRPTHSELNPAPVSPTNSSSWSLLSSTIQTIYSSKFPNGLTVAPSIMTGNTDTRFMWSLSKNIYRFTPMDRKEGGMNIHTIDERVRVQDHVEAVWFFYELMRNVQEWEF